MCPLRYIDQHGYAPFESAVNDKVMQRSLSAALHGFAVNDGNSKCGFNCTVFVSSPAHGNHAGGLLAEKPLHGIPKVLLITTQGQPAHLTCGQT